MTDSSAPSRRPAAPSADQLRATFDAPVPLTVGLEEELMLLEPGGLGLSHRVWDVLDRVDGDPRFKHEFPASQVEIVTTPVQTVGEAVAQLAAGRRDLVAATDGLVRLAAAGVHPTAPAEGEVVRRSPNSKWMIPEYGMWARRQLVCALQVQVAVGDAERTLAVHDAVRSHLPELAALAANAPFHEGRDTGMASIRPKISEGLPRQGVPPPLRSWEEFAESLRWGAAAGGTPDPGTWWWEVRPNPDFGTLELRVPDAQTTLRDAAAVAAVGHSLIAWLAGRAEAGDDLAVHPTWRIAENRWSACRHGVEGELADLSTGDRRPARERLHGLLDELEPVAAELGCGEELGGARDLVEQNGTLRQRAVAAEAGVDSVPAWLTGRFLDET